MKTGAALCNFIGVQMSSSAQASQRLSRLVILNDLSNKAKTGAA